jgi:U3 small nucleolar RNA-associated protein 20
MITSISKSTRTLCSHIFVQFLLEYPLEAERVASHFNHLLKNLAYFDSDGRLIVLDVLHLLTEKFPVEVLDHYAELLFFTLVLRSANEVHKDCKSRVSDVIKKLIQKVSPPKAKTLFNTVVKMGSDDPVKRELILASKLYVFGLFIEADSKALKTNDLKMIVESSMATMKRNEKILAETILKRQQSSKLQLKDED